MWADTTNISCLSASELWTIFPWCTASEITEATNPDGSITYTHTNSDWVSSSWTIGWLSSDINIYAEDWTLAGNRTVTMAGNDLNLVWGTTTIDSGTADDSGLNLAQIDTNTAWLDCSNGKALWVDDNWDVTTIDLWTANNWLSKDANCNTVFWNDVWATDAQLLSDREIPTWWFDIDITSSDWYVNINWSNDDKLEVRQENTSDAVHWLDIVSWTKWARILQSSTLWGASNGFEPDLPSLQLVRSSNTWWSDIAIGRTAQQYHIYSNGNVMAVYDENKNTPSFKIDSERLWFWIADTDLTSTTDTAHFKFKYITENAWYVNGEQSPFLVDWMEVHNFTDTVDSHSNVFLRNWLSGQDWINFQSIYKWDNDVDFCIRHLKSFWVDQDIMCVDTSENMTEFYTGICNWVDVISWNTSTSLDYTSIQNKNLNTSTRVYIMPNWLGWASSSWLQSWIKIFGSDYNNDNVNYDDLWIYNADDGVYFNHKINWTWVWKDFIFQIDDSAKIMRIKRDLSWVDITTVATWSWLRGRSPDWWTEIFSLTRTDDAQAWDITLWSHKSIRFNVNQNWALINSLILHSNWDIEMPSLSTTNPWAGSNKLWNDWWFVKIA